MRLRDCRIGHRLMLGFGVVILLTLVLGVTFMRKIQQLAVYTETTYRHPLVVSNAVRDIRVELYAIQDCYHELAKSEGIVYEESFGVCMVDYEGRIDRAYAAIEERYLGPRHDVSNIRRGVEKWLALGRQGFALMDEGQVDQAQEVLFDRGDEQLMKTLEALEVIAAFASNKADELYGASQQIYRHQLYWLGGMLGAIVVLSSLVAWRISRSITRPIEQVVSEIQPYAQGNFARPLTVVSGDELGCLAKAFNLMIDELQENITTLGRLQEEVSQRREAQHQLQQYHVHLEYLVEKRTQNLEAVNKELEAFSYSVSHDLRAPLRGIDGFCRALLEDYREVLDDTGKDYLDRVRGASQRMGKLIEDLLNLSRLTRAEMHFETVDLSELAELIRDRLFESEPDRAIPFVIEPGLKVVGDKNLLEVALDNLMSNSWKFTAGCEDAKIEFGCQETDGQETFYVKDNGVGFDMAYADKLFGAFQRLHDQKSYPGTGIGLATVQRVINRHGGEIWASSQEGVGSCFYFTLQCKECDYDSYDRHEAKPVMTEELLVNG